MDSAEFKDFGNRMIDWITKYKETITTKDPISHQPPGYLAALLRSEAPLKPEKFEKIWDEFDKDIMSGVTHWNHPQFHGYFPAGDAYTNIIADALNAAIGSNCFSWVCNPVGTELETIVLDWFARAIGLPKAFQSDESKFVGGGCFQASASDATLVAALAARARAIELLRDGAGQEVHDSAYLSELVVYSSKEAHSSVEKACKMALIRLRTLETDEFGNMQGKAVADAIRQDVAQGLTPCMVVVTLGTTGLVAYDNLKDIAKVVRGANLKIPMWIHVDAAYSGSTFICPEYRSSMEGVEEADSFLVNPNKLMLGAFDMTCFFVKDVKTFGKSLVINPTYLENNYTNERQMDYRHMSVALSRRFRSLKLFFLMRSYGISGLQNYVRNICQNAIHFLELVKKDPRFEVFEPMNVGLIGFKFRDIPGATIKQTNDRTRYLGDVLHDSHKLYVVPTCFNGKLFVRFSVNFAGTTRKNIEDSWKIISETADTVPEIVPDKPKMFSFAKNVTMEEYVQFKKSYRLIDCATPVYYVDGTEHLMDYNPKPQLRRMSRTMRRQVKV